MDRTKVMRVENHKTYMKKKLFDRFQRNQRQSEEEKKVENTSFGVFPKN